MDKALQQQIKLSEMWDGHLFNELIQKAMLEIESRAPLRKLSKAEIEKEEAQGMRRGSS